MSCELCEAQKEVNRQLAELCDRLFDRLSATSSTAIKPLESIKTADSESVSAVLVDRLDRAA